ncbi:MAG TPA: Asp23/Gls24 family envelope stress response protein [Lentisphaeria bacterium]|nr:Asp23/Gls24 family envelope stress response protein [Lentisphaeria bacterium]
MKKAEEISNPTTEQAMYFKTIESITDYGSVKINERVIMSIVKNAALKVDGVSSLPSGSFVNCLTNMITNAKNHDKAIKLDINGTDIKVDLKINVSYGKNIPELALKVQNTITDEVKTLTGMNVMKVDVEVQEVDSQEGL